MNIPHIIPKRNRFPFKWYQVLLVLTFLLSGLIVPGNTIPIKKQNSVKELYREAWKAVNKKKFADAEKMLKQLLKTDPLYFEADKGSAFYLLSRVYLDQKDLISAFLTLKKGVDSLSAANVFEPFTLYQFLIVSLNFPQEVDDRSITRYYFEILKKADARLHRKFLKKMYKQSRFIFPYRVQRDFEEILSRKQSGKHPGLVLWNYWRKEDPTPATFVNERIVEFFVRLNYVLQHFPARNERGFDDRGMIYIKLGPPDRIATAIKKVTARYRPHYVWSYESLVKGLYFPFIDFQKGDGYELVPSIERALPLNASLSVRREFYTQLGRAAPFFFKRLDEIESIYRDMGYTPGVKNKALDRISELDWDEKRFRERVTPSYVFRALDDVKKLPIHFRTARFLENDNRTRLELYGGVSKKDLWDKSMKKWAEGDTVTSTLYLSLENTNYISWQRRSRILARIGDRDEFKPEFIVFKNVFVVDSSRFYVSGQVEDWWQRPMDRVKEKEIRKTETFWRNLGNNLGKLVKMSAFRSELVEALPNPDSGLVLSDLVLSSKVETRLSPNGDEKIYVQPFPFSSIYRFQPLYVYFEIYGLQIPTDEPGRYKIAFSAEVLSEDKNFLSQITDVVKKQLKRRIETESEYETFQSRTKEWLQLDFSRLVPGKIRFTVTVTDLLSGKSESRDVDFQLL